MLKCFAKCFLIAGFAMSEIATPQGCLCMQSNARLDTSGLMCENGQIGYFLIGIGQTGVQILKKLSFKEMCDQNQWTQDLPKTQDGLKAFAESTSDSSMVNVFSKVSAELVCCCLDHGNLDAKFQKLRDFVVLLEGFESENKKQIIGHMGSALVRDFVDFKVALKEYIEENEEINPNDDFSFHLLKEKLMELNSILGTVGCAID